MNVSGVKLFAQDQGLRKQYIYLYISLALYFHGFSSKLVWKFGNWIAQKAKIARTSNVSNPIELQTALYITIDPGAAGSWTVMINYVKAIMENNGGCNKLYKWNDGFHLSFHLIWISPSFFMNLTLYFVQNVFICVPSVILYWVCLITFSHVSYFLGEAQFSEAVGYPMIQQWRVRSNLYKVKLSSITLSTGQYPNNIIMILSLIVR